MKVDENLARCAQINFENFEKAMPLVIRTSPFYLIAKAQLDEALGGKTVEESLRPYIKELGVLEFKEDGTEVRTGIMKDAKVTRS